MMADQTIFRQDGLLQAILDASAEGIALADAAGNIALTNRRFHELWRIPVPAAAGAGGAVAFRDALEHLTDAHAHAVRSRMLGVARDETEEVLQFRDGRAIAWVDRPLRIDGQSWRIWNFRDIPDLAASAQPDPPLCGSRECEVDRLRLAAGVFAVSQEGIVITDARHCIVDVNPAFSRITGYAREEVLGKTPALLKSDRHGAGFFAAMNAALKNARAWRGEIWNRRKSGAVFPAMLAINAVADAAGEICNYVGVFSDISQIKQHEAELDLVAHYDTLTGLPNRRLLADRMRQARSRAKRSGKYLAVCFLDLDGFKLINDAYGHEAGDELLVNVARCLQRTLRADDTLARMGGDEFVVLYNDFDHEQECCQALERALGALAALRDLNGRPLAVTASIGVTLYPRDDADADTLLRHADQCMYWAKQAGKNRYHVYDPELDRSISMRRDEREVVAEALARGEFVLHFQPKINLVNREVIGVEGLIRWQHPTRGLLPPGDFLPGLVSTPLEITLGEWVIEEALRQMSAWDAAGQHVKVSVNVSPDHLRQTDFALRLRAMLERHPFVPPENLELEIRECASLGEAEHVSRTLAQCLALGVQFSLDDFGTGSSSLTYLRRLLVQSVKIDGSFVRDMLEDPEHRGMVGGIIGMTQALNHNVIAEGVESLRHGEALIKLGCRFGQGYGIARPMPAAELPQWMADWKRGREPAPAARGAA